MNLIGAADLQFETFMLSIRSPFSTSVFKAITVLGETSLVVIAAVVIGYLLWRSPLLKASAAGLILAVTGAGISSYVLKQVVARVRPDGLLPAVLETSPSFPSGHATLAMALYGFTAYALCKRFPAKAPSILSAATLLILAIGASRLYLGVHFPSDVLAGYLLGGAWVWIGIRATRFLSTRQSV
jgi:undecaprenyl-diphosphatase